MSAAPAGPPGTTGSPTSWKNLASLDVLIAIETAGTLPRLRKPCLAPLGTLKTSPGLIGCHMRPSADSTSPSSSPDTATNEEVQRLRGELVGLLDGGGVV